MSSLLKLRRGSTVSHSTFTGADGEVTFNTDTNALVSHDGATAGGFPHVKAADLAASSGASLVGFIQSGTGAVATTQQARDRLAVYITDFGAVADDITKGEVNNLAFEYAIAHFPTVPSYYSGYAYAGKIIVPYGGRYTMARTINIDRQVEIEWESPADGNAIEASQLKFPADTDGIYLHSEYTSASGTSATGTRLIKPNIVGAGSGAGTSGHGIVVKSRCTIINPMVDAFRLDGINIEAQAGVSGNANLFLIEKGRSQENGRHGLFVDGPDANAGNIIGLDCSANLGWGIYDSSFLGNTYTGCHTASNTLGAYKTDSANGFNVFTGCYSESGQPESSFVSPTLVLGGLHAAGITSASTATQLIGSALTFGYNGSATAPSLKFATDKASGFYPHGTDLGQWNWSSLGLLKGRLGNGWIKMTTDGTFYNSAGVHSEFVQSNTNQPSCINYLKSTAYAGLGNRVVCDTAASTAFNLITTSSVGGAFNVLGTGSCQNTLNSYGAVSDIKLKENITDATPKLSSLMQVRVVNYNLKTTPNQKQLGVIAQELEHVFPGLVESQPDRDDEGILTGEETKSVKYSVFVPMLIKAMQEQQTLINSLSERLAALESA